MKIQTAALAVIFLALLSACNNPAVIPADLAVTLPPNQDFIVRATQPSATWTRSSCDLSSMAISAITASNAKIKIRRQRFTRLF